MDKCSPACEDVMLRYPLSSHHLSFSGFLTRERGRPARITKRRKQIERELNKGYGSCILHDKEIAEIVVVFDGKRYDLVPYVVMSNHVHVLIKTYERFPLSKVTHSWKSFTAHEHEIDQCLNNRRICGRDARAPGVWQNEYFDRFIHDERHFVQAIDYIHENPVKAGLCRKASEWPWSSAREWIAR